MFSTLSYNGRYRLNVNNSFVTFVDTIKWNPSHYMVSSQSKHFTVKLKLLYQQKLRVQVTFWTHQLLKSIKKYKILQSIDQCFWDYSDEVA